MSVIDVFPPLELDLLIGLVNTLYGGLEKVWPRSEDWLELCNVKKVNIMEANWKEITVEYFSKRLTRS